MSEEVVPTFFVDGEHIADVVYTIWIQVNDGTWTVAAEERIEVLEKADRVVFETPIGCYQLRLSLAPGDRVRFYPGGGARLERCTRPRSFEDRESVADEQEVLG